MTIDDHQHGYWKVIERWHILMRYHQLHTLSETEFKRLCGVSRGTFSAMIAVLRPQLDRQGRRGGQNKLSVEDQ